MVGEEWQKRLGCETLLINTGRSGLSRGKCPANPKGDSWSFFAAPASCFAGWVPR